ncbi:histidine phosphatase family protein [Desulfolutivibrio sp.]|uniref:histidine phosphatase family protein n=1 Tax=Desulfolutivibrio sp. TaxID=2773296 RepID=UPI002F964BB9
MRRVRVWLFRHGELPQVSPRRFVGQSDISLSETGRRQAGYWASALARVPFALAVASDLSRCLETARIMLHGRDIPLRLEPRWREIGLGEWEGLTVAQVRERFPGCYEARGADLAGFRPAGGESFADVQARAGAALAALVSEVGEDREAGGADATLGDRDGGWIEVLAVAHGGVNRTFLCGLLGMPLANLFRLGQDYGCLNLLEFVGGGPGVAAMNIRPGSAFGPV